jgi:hypothetical protein
VDSTLNVASFHRREKSPILFFGGDVSGTLDSAISANYELTEEMTVEGGGGVIGMPRYYRYCQSEFWWHMSVDSLLPVWLYHFTCVQTLKDRCDMDQYPVE